MRNGPGLELDNIFHLHFPYFWSRVNYALKQLECVSHEAM